MTEPNLKNVTQLRDVPLVPEDEPKLLASQVQLATTKIFPCESCDKEFTNLQARALHMKNSHKIDTLKYTPAPVKNKPWIYCKKCPTKKKTEEEIKSHTIMMHQHIKRSLSEMKRGQIQRVESAKLSPPQKKPKGKPIHPKTNTKMDNPEFGNSL